MRKLGYIFLLLGSIYAYSSVLPTSKVQNNIENSIWKFSGIVTTDEGTKYGYFFKVNKTASKILINTELLEADTGKVLLKECASIDNNSNPATLDNIKTEHVFIKYNPVNERWVLGIKQDKNLGFSFKIDMLQVQNSVTEPMNNNIELQVVQTGRVNGHMQLTANTPDKFVSANRTWLAITKIRAGNIKNSHVSNMLCQFNDNSGFYNTNISQNNITKSNITKFASANGQSLAISQFIQILNNKDNTMQINIPYPYMQLNLSVSDANSADISGFFHKEANSLGFCTFDNIG